MSQLGGLCYQEDICPVRGMGVTGCESTHAAADFSKDIEAQSRQGSLVRYSFSKVVLPSTRFC
jgi:hypothetical protein